MIDSFKTDTKEIRLFLDSIRSNVVYVIPALIETFAEKYRYHDPKTLKELMDSESNIGSLFVLVNDQSDWTYVGVSTNGKPMARLINSDLVLELNPDEEIRWVF